jgi:hypothetical protein
MPDKPRPETAPSDMHSIPEQVPEQRAIRLLDFASCQEPGRCFFEVIEIRDLGETDQVPVIGTTETKTKVLS